MHFSKDLLIDKTEIFKKMYVYKGNLVLILTARRKQEKKKKDVKQMEKPKYQERGGRGEVSLERS